MTRAYFKRPVWTWFCDRCGKTGGDLATEQRDLPTPEQMRRRRLLIAKPYKKKSHKSDKAERAERAS